MTPGLVHPAWKLAVWAIIAAAGWLTLGAYAWLWWQHPAAAAPIAAYAVGLFCGLWLRDRRRKTVAVVAEWQGEEIDAIKTAAMREDDHYVRISGETSLYDAADDPAFTDTEARS